MELTSFSVFWQQFLFEHWSKRQQRGDPNRFQQQRLWCWNDLLMKVGLLSVSVSAWIKQTQTCGSLYLALVSRSSPIPFLCFFSFTFKTEKNTKKNIYIEKRLVLLFSSSLISAFKIFNWSEKILNLPNVASVVPGMSVTIL